MVVVNAKGSGTGRECCWRMYSPVLRCHQKSGSEISGENQPIASAAESASNSGRNQRGMVEVTMPAGGFRGFRSLGGICAEETSVAWGRSPTCQCHGAVGHPLPLL